MSQQAQDTAINQAQKSSGFFSNVRTYLKSNEPINSLGGAYEMGAQIFADKKGVKEAFNDVFTEETDEFELDDNNKTKLDEHNNPIKKRKMKMGKLMGSAWATYAVGATAFGAFRGAFSDGQGNLDVKGIPFI